MPFLGKFGSLPVSAVVLLVCYSGTAWFLNKVSIGRHIFAVGGNPQAARVSGINVDRILLIVYAMSGFFAGLAGLLMAGRTGAGFPNAGIGAELDAIAAVIIGGASFFGGRGTVLGVFAGVLVMGAAPQRAQPDGRERLLAADPHRHDRGRGGIRRRASSPRGKPRMTSTDSGARTPAPGPVHWKPTEFATKGSES